MFSLGILYRTQEFLELISERLLTQEEFRRSFPRFGLVDSQEIVSLARKCRWCETRDASQALYLTKQGQEVLATEDPTLRLRAQLRDIMRYSPPPWIGLLRRGRSGFASYGSADTLQCFHAAGLLGANDLQTATWWDDITAPLWRAEALERLTIGRRGEYLSLRLEEQRLGRKPEWTALEDSSAGYDVLSWVERGSEIRLVIEVKASEQSPGSASFYLSRHEWGVLSCRAHALIHLWSLATDPETLYVVQPKLLAEHMPLDQGDADWASTLVPYSVGTKYYCGRTP